MLWRFWNVFLGYIYGWRSLHPQNHTHTHTKNHHRSLKEIWHQPKLLLLFKIHIKFSKKLLVQLPLSYLVLFLKLYSVLTMFSPQKHPKIVTGPLNGYGIVWIRVCSEHLLRIPAKLLVKLRFRDFQKWGWNSCHRRKKPNFWKAIAFWYCGRFG